MLSLPPVLARAGISVVCVMCEVVLVVVTPGLLLSTEAHGVTSRNTKCFVSL